MIEDKFAELTVEELQMYIVKPEREEKTEEEQQEETVSSHTG